jgi:arabinogalactan endo-1,4-beta-galactosidase
MKKNILISFSTVLFLSCFSWSTQSEILPQPVESIILAPVPFVKRAHLVWLPQRVATGCQFFDQDGTPKNGLQLLKDFRIYSEPLRLWVNPFNHKIDGHCSKEESVVRAVCAQKSDRLFRINFHYSNSWANPAKQNIPLAWANPTGSQLKQEVYSQTLDLLTALKHSGITPKLVQEGNAIL